MIVHHPGHLCVSYPGIGQLVGFNGREHFGGNLPGFPLAVGRPNSITYGNDSSTTDVEVPSNALNVSSLCDRPPDHCVHLLGPQCRSRAHSIRISEGETEATAEPANRNDRPASQSLFGC
jgi:hypothetical protein